MFMGDEDSIQLIESNVAGSETSQGFAFAESAIDEEAGALRFKQRDVARTAGSQNGNAQADRSFSEQFVAAKSSLLATKQIFRMMAERGGRVNEEEKQKSRVHK
jgi:hypothetical protein